MSTSTPRPFVSRSLALVLAFLTLALAWPAMATAAEVETEAEAPDKLFPFAPTVRCELGQSIAHALQIRRFFRQVTIKFTGACDEDLVIARDRVTLRGDSPDATILGLIDVFGGSNITFEDFTVLGEISDPIDTGRGAINVENGGAITLNNIHIQTQNVRGVRVINSTASLNDVTMDDILVGGFVFRASNLTISGDIVATRCVFGMTLVDSNAIARNANFTLDDNFFAGMIIQINSGFEHVEGVLSANNNPFGILLASNAVYAHGSFLEISGATTAGILIDELSSITPLGGAPGGGPGITVTDNPGDGIVVDRFSTLETFAATVTGNATGLLADNSEVRLAGATIESNATDVSLAFGTKLVTNGEDNVIGSPIVCDASVLTRGALSCGAAPAAAQAVSSRSAVVDLSNAELRAALPESTFLGLMGSRLKRHER
ncbi:MAG: hypothetical protein AAF657_30830 [Acidobacteriota bacterium]